MKVTMLYFTTISDIIERHGFTWEDVDALDGSIECVPWGNYKYSLEHFFYSSHMGGYDPDSERAKTLEAAFVSAIEQVKTATEPTTIEEDNTMTQNITENQDRCKSIADTLELVAEGRFYICPECGEFFDCNETEEGEEYTTLCPECNKELDTNALEQMSMLDYFQDVYNIEYRIDANGEYKSVELMVACGGPNIYVDTKTATINLYWWGDSASWEFSRDTANAIDEAFEEVWACK